MDSLPIVESVVPTPRFAFDDSPHWHLFETDVGNHVFVTDGSRIYSVDSQTASALDRSAFSVDKLESIGIPSVNAVSDERVTSMPLHALSLAVAQKCNLGCTYCYAEGGSFGDKAKNMSIETARAAIDRLLLDANSGENVNLSFLGGEPLANRSVIRDATLYAVDSAASKGVNIGFSITTNGTLLNTEDALFFEEHAFAVTISLDGVGEAHDRLRAYKSGGGSYDRIMRNVAPCLQLQRRMQISARVTVTPSNLDVKSTLDEFVRLGFHSVGFSPLLSSPSGTEEMQSENLLTMLGRMIECGREFEAQVIKGARYPFTNMVNALKEIHRGTHRPYPCGAGAGYFGVSADGELAACHRFVGDPDGEMGALSTGVDLKKQDRWLRNRHVHFQQPCSGCWAKYLCGGGCHHEVLSRGRQSCEYIRGWLHYCLEAYARLLARRPDYFGATL